MGVRKGGLGSVEPAGDREEDLLDRLFGEKPAQEQDESAPPKKGASPERADTVAKYFRLDRALAKRLKIYAAEHEMREAAVMAKALNLLFESERGE